MSSIIHGQLLCYSDKFSVKTCEIPIFSFSKNFSRRKVNVIKLSTDSAGRNFVTSPLTQPPTVEEADSDTGGIGILKFFQGTNIFVTGATGPVGKVLVEKILRSTDVGKIYVLIKAKDTESANDRLNKEIINSELFKILEEMHGKGYIKEKMVAIAGNLCEPNLGMDDESVNIVSREVDVIIQSAAGTTLNDRYDTLIDLNVNAPRRMMMFAKSCKNLKLLAHISTAFVGANREGLILEKALSKGEEVSCSLDLDEEIRVATKSTVISSSDKNLNTNQHMKRLGQQRAEIYGWDNAYQMTKAMGEMVVSNEMNEGKVPYNLVIIRPTVIESCLKEPLPGWIQGNRVLDPVIISYGRGRLPAYLADSQVIIDIIPVDMVVNTTMAAMAKHGLMSEKTNIHNNLYHVGSGALNPITYGYFFDIIHEYFDSKSNDSLFRGGTSMKRIRFFDNFDDLSKYTRDQICGHQGSMMVGNIGHKRAKAEVAYAEQLCKMYEFSGFLKARFDTQNTEKLVEEMSGEELLKFEADVRSINWRKYIQEIHISGLMKYVINKNK